MTQQITKEIKLGIFLTEEQAQQLVNEAFTMWGVIPQTKEEQEQPVQTKKKATKTKTSTTTNHDEAVTQIPNTCKSSKNGKWRYFLNGRDVVTQFIKVCKDLNLDIDEEVRPTSAYQGQTHDEIKLAMSFKFPYALIPSKYEAIITPYMSKVIGA